MKNNRCAPHTGRGDPPERSGTQGSHPVIDGVRGDPPWMFISRGDPPLVGCKWNDPPDKNENRNSQATPELVEGVVSELVEERIIGCKNRQQARGMSDNEQLESGQL